jgi:SPP1 gp7 family putative phage head morphogenesis protein
MREAYQQQSGPQAFARAIRDEFDALSKAKAEQIAETEWNRAASQATLNAYQKQGVERVVWITLGDSRVCEICENNAADGEIAIGSAFFSGDQAPPAHPSCRCSLSSA